MKPISKKRARVGLFAVGLEAYWAQFPGLKERLMGYLAHVESQVTQWADVVSAGLVDTAESAWSQGERLARELPEFLICYTATYATSSQVLPLVQQARVPVLILNLQPVAALDYEHTDTGEWLANCSACCAPEIAGAFTRAGIEYHVVSGTLYKDDRAWEQVREWCEAAAVVGNLRGSRFGFLGHTYPGMLDMYSDFTQQHAQLGIHVEVLEMCDLQDRVNKATDSAVETKIVKTREIFDIADTVTEDNFRWAAQVAVGLDRLVEDFRLDALAYYYRGTQHNAYERLGAGLILGNSLLTARGIPCAGEGDLKNSVAMKIMDLLNVGGSFTEFYAMDFQEQFLLMGHDGPGHLGICDRRPVLRGLGLYHGKAGLGVSVEFNVKTGPVTILGVTQTKDGHLKLVAAEGESIPGPIMHIGNTNSRLRFSLPPAEFTEKWCEEGPTHHCALGIGHSVARLRKVASLLGLEMKVVGQ